MTGCGTDGAHGDVARLARSVSRVLSHVEPTRLCEPGYDTAAYPLYRRRHPRGDEFAFGHTVFASAQVPPASRT